MTKVSRRILNKELEEGIFEVFIQAVIDLKSPREVKNFIEDLLFPTEKIMLVKRLAIALLLSKGYTYDEIDRTLKVSRTTIMNVSYFLKHGSYGGYQKVVERIIKNQKREELLDKIEEILLRLSPPKLYGSGAFEKKQSAGKELYKKKLKRSLLQSISLDY